MRLHDRVRIEVAVQRVGWWLDWHHMPGRHRRQTLRELRANLVDATEAGELGDALTRLGAPRAMAAAYLENGRPGLRWRTGLVAAMATFVAVTCLTLAFSAGFAEGVQAAGSEVGEVYETGRALVVGDRPLTTFQQTEDARLGSGSLVTWPHLVSVVIAFGAFARPWRALRRRGARQAQPA